MKLAHNSYQFILKLWNCTCCLILCDEPNPKEWQLIVSGRVFAFENVKVLVIELLLTWKITMHMSEYVRSMSEVCPKMSEVCPKYSNIRSITLQSLHLASPRARPGSHTPRSFNFSGTGIQWGCGAAKRICSFEISHLQCICYIHPYSYSTILVGMCREL